MEEKSSILHLAQSNQEACPKNLFCRQYSMPVPKWLIDIIHRLLFRSSRSILMCSYEFQTRTERATLDYPGTYARVIAQRQRGHYQLQTKYSILDRLYPTSELNPIPPVIDIYLIL